MICLISHKINAKYVIIFQTRNTAMGIRKKIQQQFYFYFCCRKVRYSGITTAKLFKHGNYLK